MKNFLIPLCLLLSTITFAQQEWGDVKNNVVTMNEIAPIWPGCEGNNVSQRDACFDKKLMQHVVKNFRYPASAYKQNIQGKVTVIFNINEKGLVDIKSVTGGNPDLQKEAKRNIASIPKMKPGMLAGKPRAIKYTVPFNFKTGK